MDKPHSKPPLQVILTWHMHQPDYFDPTTGQFRAPWTYLHAIKDYADMAAHLEANARMQAVVNFTPILLESLAQYQQDLKAVITGNGRIHDPLLAALHQPLVPEEPERRLTLVRACLRAGGSALFANMENYHRLAAMAERMVNHIDELNYLNEQFFVDLLMWYHLGWIGETIKRHDGRIRELMRYGRHFTAHHCRMLVGVIREIIDGIVPRYRALVERGQIELSVTPYSHPILPLLLDFNTAHEALPDCPLPASSAYPGGEARARWQLQRAREVFEQFFGMPPSGCWPSEGGLSTRTVALAGETGFQWLASGRSVLEHSLKGNRPDASARYRPYRVGDQGPACFFRDDDLSDAIGFVYRDWHADDAISDFIHRLEHIASTLPDDQPWVVPVILDGENAWEYYPDNGFHFLDGLYKALSGNPRIQTTTYSRYLQEHWDLCGTLPALVSGSWVYGNFSTWIGESEKNRAWDLIVAAKRVYDDALPELDDDQRGAAERQLALCESSDWFWWLGKGQSEEVVSLFERLLRLHLLALYQILEREPPDEIAHAFTRGQAHGEAEAMHRAH